MANKIPWMRTLSARLGLIVLLLLAASITLVLMNTYLLAKVEGAATKQKLFSLGPTFAYELAANTWQLPQTTGSDRRAIEDELHELLTANEKRYRVLLDGDPAHGLPPVEAGPIRDGLEERAELVHSTLRPAVQRVIDARSDEDATAAASELHDMLAGYADSTAKAADVEEVRLNDQTARIRFYQLVFAGVMVVAIGMVLWIARGITRRCSHLAVVADRLAAGELEQSARVGGSDELFALGESLDGMARNLRDMIETEKEARKRVETLLEAIVDTANGLASSSAEILASTTQQASGAQEQAAAVAQTVTTVEEVTQTADQASERARSLSEASQRSVEVGKAGRKAVEDAVAGMGEVRTQNESIAESILALAEQAQSISEIIATVNEIAEQTNLLALNAGIEASRAGEHGKGFSVVAAEVKALAEQSKKATAQVRKILGEIQRATNRAVMTAEEGTKKVNHTIEVTGRADDTIRALSEVISGAAQAATQIAASARQQSAGMSQIHQAMSNINQVTNQNVASARQAERAARDLNALGSKLKALLT